MKRSATLAVAELVTVVEFAVMGEAGGRVAILGRDEAGVAEGVDERERGDARPRDS